MHREEIVDLYFREEYGGTLGEVGTHTGVNREHRYLDFRNILGDTVNDGAEPSLGFLNLMFG